MNEEMGNPFELIYPVISSKELLDLAFSKAMKIKPPTGRKSDRLSRSRIHELNRINTAANVFVDRLNQVIHQFPTIEKIHPYYQEMADLFSGVDQLKIVLGRIQGVVNNIRKIQEETSEDMIISLHKEENKQYRRRAFGRFSSIINRIAPFLEQIEVARRQLSLLPGFNPFLPTVVISGIPNAGKSSFIKLTTSGNPEIAAYPFTTTEIIFGHRKIDFLSIQFVDTPGLLDRNFMERNEIELKALLALKYLADVLVFFLDPTDDASCSIEEQFNLLEEIKNFYPTLALLVAITKNDLVSKEKVRELQINIIKNFQMNSDEIYTINTKHPSGTEQFLLKLEHILKFQVLKSPKFRKIARPEIDPEFIRDEDDNLDIY